MELKSYIDSIENFPIEGVTYRDIQPLLEDSEAFWEGVLQMTELVDLEKVDYFVGIESRGFIFASAMAALTLKGLKLIRKGGKLPGKVNSVEYGLEYGRDTIEMKPGWGNIVLVDDVYATGGTIAAAEILAETSGYQVLDSVCLLDIGLIKEHDTKCVISY